MGHLFFLVFLVFLGANDARIVVYLGQEGFLGECKFGDTDLAFFFLDVETKGGLLQFLLEGGYGG